MSEPYHRPVKPILVTIPSIRTPIMRSPGFEKKELATHKLDVMGLCGFGCLYCSSSTGNYLRINRGKFLEMTREQTGQDLLPATSPELSFRWGDFEERLDAQLATKPKDGSWGAGRTLVCSQLTDMFSPWAVSEGLTLRTLKKALLRTSFRLRLLTKSASVANAEFLDLMQAHPDRFVVGLSIGTLDDGWASRVEIGTSPPSARVRALHKLQDAGVKTFGMLCPVFPDVFFEAGGVGRLVNEIRPERCETVWSEPYNDRSNWRLVADGYEPGSRARERFGALFEGPSRQANWTSYAVELYERVHAALGSEAHKHRYLLYQEGMLPAEKERLRGKPGVLFQSDESEKEGPTDAA